MFDRMPHFWGRIAPGFSSCMAPRIRLAKPNPILMYVERYYCELMTIPTSLLPDLPALLMIAEEAHFGRAAGRLNVSQPRMSQIVRRAEDLVGYQLFVRRPQVRLTAAGELFIKSVRHALANLDDGFARAADVAAGRGGTVRLGYSPVAMLTQLPRLIKTFRGKNPRVTLQLQEDFSASLWAGLEAGKFDVIISRESRVHPGIRNSLFLRDSLVAVLPEDDAAASAIQLPAAMLRDRDFIAIEESVAPQWHGKITAFCHSANLELRVVQRANDWAAILALVASGVGISLVSSTLSQLRFPGVKFVTLTEGVGIGSFWVSYQETAIDPAAKLLRSELTRGAAQSIGVGSQTAADSS